MPKRCQRYAVGQIGKILDSPRGGGLDRPTREAKSPLGHKTRPVDTRQWLSLITAGPNVPLTRPACAQPTRRRVAAGGTIFQTRHDGDVTTRQLDAGPTYRGSTRATDLRQRDADAPAYRTQTLSKPNQRRPQIRVLPNLGQFWI